MTHLHANMWRPNRDADERDLVRKRSPAKHIKGIAFGGSRTVKSTLAMHDMNVGKRADKLLRKWSWEE